MTKEEYYEVDVYCLRCKKTGKVKDLVRPDGTLPFIYDGCYECDDCKADAKRAKEASRCSKCGRTP